MHGRTARLPPIARSIMHGGWARTGACRPQFAAGALSKPPAGLLVPDAASCCAACVYQNGKTAGHVVASLTSVCRTWHGCIAYALKGLLGSSLA
jgi:hypothetical protein